MKIMTFNIRRDSTNDPLTWSERKDYVVNVIKKYQPDVIGFQEVLKHMEDDLANSLTDYEYYGEYRSQEEDSEMVPVFLKKGQYVMADKGSFMLSETPAVMYSKSWDSACERVASWVVINDKDSQEPRYIALNVHLDHRGNEARRKSSIMLNQTISEMFEKVGVPVIMTGDFNAEPDSQLIDPLLDSDFLTNSHQAMLSNVNVENYLTFHNYAGGSEGQPIDYVFVTKQATIKNAEIIRDQFDGNYPSDHYPVLIEI